MKDYDEISHETRELVLYAINTREPYERYIMPIVASLAKKARKGIYSRDLALKYWRRVADAVAKAYAKDYDHERNWNRIFSVQNRKDAAEFFKCYFDMDVE